MLRSRAFTLYVLVFIGFLLNAEAAKANIWAYTKIELYKNSQRVGTQDGPGQYLGLNKTAPALYNVNYDDEYAKIFPEPEQGQYVAIYSEASASDQLNESSDTATHINTLWTNSDWAGLLDDIAETKISTLSKFNSLKAKGKSKELAFQIPYPNPYYDKIVVTYLAYSDDDQLDPLLYIPDPSQEKPFLSVDYCSSGCWSDRDRYDIQARFVKHHQWVKYTIDLIELRKYLTDERFYSPNYFPIELLVCETESPALYFGPRLFLVHIVKFYSNRNQETPPLIKTTVNYRFLDHSKTKNKLLGISATSSEIMSYAPRTPFPSLRSVGNPEQTQEIHLQPDKSGIFRINGKPYNYLSIVFTTESNRVFDPNRPQIVLNANLQEGKIPKELQPKVTEIIPSLHHDENGLQYHTEGLGAAIVKFDPKTVDPGIYNLVFSAHQKQGAWNARQIVRIIIHERGDVSASQIIN
jgi:hypothetical protein